MSEEQILGLEGEECRGCRAPLAADQRYCLNCGRRRGASRVDLEALGAAPAPGASGAPVPAPAAPAPPPAAWTPMTIVGGIAVLAVVLLVGVMLGNDKNQDPVQVAAAPAAATVADTTTATKTGDKVASTDTGKSTKDSGSSKDSGQKDKVVDPTKAPGAETVTDDQLNALDQASGDDYAKQSKNLPDTIALPGEPPPKDNQEPGAGTSAQVIK